MGASFRLPHKVEGSWREREKQQEEKEEEKQLREERMREESIRIYTATAKGFVSMKHTVRERADPWEATPTWQKTSGRVGLETGQCWGMAHATVGWALSEPQPAPSQHSQQELRAGILRC